VLKSMGKRITVEQVQRALDLTRKSRIGIQGNLIFGDRAETAQSVDESFRWYDDHSEYLLGLGMISCYPGSPLYRYAKEQGLIRNLEYFLRSGGGIVNVTAMPELEFQRIWLVSEYSAAKAQLDNRVAPQLARVTGRDQRGDRLYEFTTKCPKCGAANSYEDFNVASGGCLLMCKTCLQRSWLSFAPLKDYWAVFVNGSFVRLPPRIGYPAFITYWRLRHLSDFTLRQNILRVSRFVSKWARARRRSRGEEAAS
jgi:hypothetical protein